MTNLDQTTKTLRKIITESYIHGIFNEGKIERFKQLFHDDFAILLLNDVGELQYFTRQQWIKSLTTRRQDSGFDPKSLAYRGEFRNIDISKDGKTAAVSLDIFHETVHIYTDHLLLIQAAEGWKVVSKVFSRFE